MTQSKLFRPLSRRRAVQVGAAGAATGLFGKLPNLAFAQTPAAEVAAYNGEEATVTYGFWDTAQEAAIDAQIEAFKAHFPNITIEKQIVPWADYWTQLQTAVAGGSTFDTFWINVANLPVYASAGALLPITQIIGGDGGIDTTLLPASLVESYAYDGVQYGVPRDFDAIAVFYNKTIFDNAGVPYPADTWTWDDFRAAADELTDPSAGIWGAGLQTSFQETWINFIFQNNGSILNEDRTACTINEPEADEAIQYLTHFFLDEVTPAIAIQQTNPVAETLFPAGQVGFITAGSFRAGTYGDLDLDLAIAPLPQKARQATITHGLANVIWKNASNPGAALEWVKFLHGEEAELILGDSGATIPALSGTQGTFVESNTDLNLQVFVDAALNYGVSQNWPLAGTAFLDEIQNVLVDGWAGNVPVEEITAKAAEAANAKL